MSLSAEENERLTDMLSALSENLGPLSEWETGFVKDQIERHKKYGAGIFMSAKQWVVLKKIYDAVIGDEEEGDPLQEIDDELPF